jgi:hypothetical protein
MKKSLIALAALAAFGTASAQSTVTISGNLNAGFAGDTSELGAKTGGYGIDTANVTLSVSEDLGGGLTAFGSMSLENFREDEPVNGNGVTLGLRGDFGTVTFSSAEGSDFLPVDGLTAASDGTDADRITYTTPKISGFTFSLSHQDAIDAGNSVVTSISSVGMLAPPEINADARGTSSALTGAVNYSVGPISVDAVHADFTGHATITSRTGARAAYDFGMAKLTYGMMKQKMVASGVDVTETGLTIAAPLGPVTASYSYATSKTEGGTGLTKKGTSLTLSYALSKRSNLYLYNEEFDHPGSAALTASKTKEYFLLLRHTF